MLERRRRAIRHWLADCRAFFADTVETRAARNPRAYQKPGANSGR